MAEVFFSPWTRVYMMNGSKRLRPEFFSVSADSWMQQNAECSLFKSTNLLRKKKSSEIRRREKIIPVAFYGCLAATADGRWGRGRWRLKKLSDYFAMTNKCECQKQAPSAAAWLVQRDKNSKKRLFCSPRRVADRKSDTRLPDRWVATVMGGKRGRLLTCNR